MSYDSDGYKMCMIAKLLGKKGKMTKQILHLFLFSHFKSSRRKYGLPYVCFYLEIRSFFVWAQKMSSGSEPKNKMEDQVPGSQSGSGTLAISREPTCMYQCFN